MLNNPTCNVLASTCFWIESVQTYALIVSWGQLSGGKVNSAVIKSQSYILTPLLSLSLEATQKAQMLPGRQSEAEPQKSKALLKVSGGQQDEPGLALSPDGPGASPEPPSLSHTPDGNAATDTLASDMLRKLAGRAMCV